MRKDLLAPALLFLGAFLLALLGLNPTFFLDDSPETVSAGVQLGIPHPPGYPLHTLLGRLFCLVPVSGFPFRVNLLSAMTAGAVVVLLFLLLSRRFRLPALPSAAASLLWMAGATTYPAALSAKGGIYHLTALLLTGILFALLYRRLLLASFLFGLALANHWMSMAVYTPGLVLLGWGVSREEKPDAVEMASMAALMTMGLSLYLVMPLRSVLAPDLNWGDPSTWARFKFNFLRSQYNQSEGTGTVGVWMRQWIYFGKSAALEMPGILPLTLWGAWIAWKRERPVARGLLLAWGLLVTVLGVYLNLKPDRYYLIDAYALSSYVFLLLFAGWCAADWIAQAPPEGAGWRSPKVRTRLVLAVLLALAVPLCGWRLARLRQDRYTFTYDYNMNLYRSLPKRALFFVRGDSIIFPSWYAQWILGVRRDVAVIGVDGLPMKWVRVILHKMHPDLKVPFPEDQVPFVGNESIAPMTRFFHYSNETRGSFFSYNKIEDGSLPEVRLVPHGLVYQGVVPPEGTGSPFPDEPLVRRLWDTMRLRHLDDHGRSQDFRTRENLLKDYAIIRNGMGVYYEDMADAAKLEAERRKRPASGELLEALYQRCYENFVWAHRWAPRDHEFAFNVGNSLYNLGRIAESTGWYSKSLELKPGYADAYYNWGVAEYQMSNFQKAGELFDEALKLDPDKKEADDALRYMLFNGMYRRAPAF